MADLFFVCVRTVHTCTVQRVELTVDVTTRLSFDLGTSFLVHVPGIQPSKP